MKFRSLFDISHYDTKIVAGLEKALFRNDHEPTPTLDLTNMAEPEYTDIISDEKRLMIQKLIKVPVPMQVQKKKNDIIRHFRESKTSKFAYYEYYRKIQVLEREHQLILEQAIYNETKLYRNLVFCVGMGGRKTLTTIEFLQDANSFLIILPNITISVNFYGRMLSASEKIQRRYSLH